MLLATGTTGYKKVRGDNEMGEERSEPIRLGVWGSNVVPPEKKISEHHLGALRPIMGCKLNDMGVLTLSTLRDNN